jgi:hypothetical protein
VLIVINGKTYSLVCLHTNTDHPNIHTPPMSVENPATDECKFNPSLYNTNHAQLNFTPQGLSGNTTRDAMLVQDIPRTNDKHFTPFMDHQIFGIMEDKYIGVIGNRQSGRGVMKILHLQRVDPLVKGHKVVTYTLEPFTLYAFIKDREWGIIFFIPPCTGIDIAPENVRVIKRTQTRTGVQKYLKDFEICMCSIDKNCKNTHPSQ